MNVAVPEEELVTIVDLLAFVANLCNAEEPLISTAMARFTGTEVYGAVELRLEAKEWADFLAQILGFADASLEPRS
jgi:hypothetical protein